LFLYVSFSQDEQMYGRRTQGPSRPAEMGCVFELLPALDPERPCGGINPKTMARAFADKQHAIIIDSILPKADGTPKHLRL
jgi:hypothetical protein